MLVWRSFESGVIYSQRKGRHGINQPGTRGQATHCYVVEGDHGAVDYGLMCNNVLRQRLIYCQALGTLVAGHTLHWWQGHTLHWWQGHTLHWLGRLPRKVTRPVSGGKLHWIRGDCMRVVGGPAG
ncbi:hypothetical protein NDU88_005655 [Pleurodeles waltl]|uniref:Uncharacterized protein n=1 Tax=Pleurodeles waltl TaxID=8319 RepID=A0AAV7TW77_PLEWA|nr:hypothetical protein NDU88_005655 [Pleurodeles waltl]